MIIFWYSSAWIKVFIEESGSTEALDLLDQAFHQDEVSLMASAITYAEMKATLARAYRGNRIAQDDYEKAVTSFDTQWEWFYVADFTESLVQRSGELASQFYLKGADAFQLASAI